MRGIYTAQGFIQNVKQPTGSQQTIAWMQGKQGIVVEILEIHVTFPGQTTDYEIECSIADTNGTPGGGGTGQFVAHEPGDQAATTQIFSNATSEPPYGGRSFGLEAQPSRGGWHFTPSKPIYLGSGGMMGIKLFPPNPTLPTNGVTVDYQIIIREIG